MSLLSIPAVSLDDLIGKLVKVTFKHSYGTALIKPTNYIDPTPITWEAEIEEWDLGVELVFGDENILNEFIGTDIDGTDLEGYYIFAEEVKEWEIPKVEE